MASRRRWLLFFLAALALALLLAYSFRHNPQWRSFQWSAFADSLLAIEGSWALAGLAAVYITYLVRALRWKALMRHLKRDPSLWNLLSASVIGSCSSGAILRPFASNCDCAIAGVAIKQTAARI